METQSDYVRWARIGLAAVAWIYAACIAVQVFLAGLSTFDSPARWADHISFGQMIGILPTLMAVLALVGRMPVLTIVLAVATFFLYGLQYPFANSSTGTVAAFHAVNALVMFWITTLVAQSAQRLAFPARPRSY